MTNFQETVDDFYVKFFTENPNWSKPFPNLDEARRSSKICEYLAQVAHWNARDGKAELRILDVGCGRGWLTNIANIYGVCEGIDPVEGVVDFARKKFPQVSFHVGNLTDLQENENFTPYDVIISSEVLEHIEDKDRFAEDLKTCLKPNGHLIITTPRGEMFEKWNRLGLEQQPVESWISEYEMPILFERHQFFPVDHDRAFVRLPGMSIFHKVFNDGRFIETMKRLKLNGINKALQYSLAIYQIWWFRLKSDG